MKIALIQIAACKEKKDSIARAADYITTAAASGVDLAVLPEMFNCPYQTDNFPVYAEPEGGSSWTAMARAAQINGLWLVAGSMPEKDEAGRVYNTCYVFDPGGKQAAKHRKMHLFDINVREGQQFRESDTLTAGDKPTLFDTPFGRFGAAICYDIRFPEYSRLLALAGAKMIIIPAAFNMTTGPAHWELSFRARALDNQVFMAGCSQARREDGGYVSWGHSIITSPWGDVVAQMDEKEGMLVCDIDLSRTDSVREQLPLLRQRRTDLYRCEWNLE